MKTKNPIKVLLVIFIILVGLSETIVAKTITLPFEFGPGTAHSVSNKRGFPVPCGLAVSANVKYQRGGDVGATNDVPIVIELRSPGAINEEGPVVASSEVSATKTQQARTLNGAANSKGCNLNWIVRVKPKSGTSQFAIWGEISVAFSDSQRNTSIEGSQITLDEGNHATKNLGASVGLPQGSINIKTLWGTIGFPTTQLAKIKVELINPQGAVVASQTGHPSNSPFSPRINLSYNIISCIPGQWKVRFTNNSDIRVKEMEPVAVINPDCPNLGTPDL